MLKDLDKDNFKPKFKCIRRTCTESDTGNDKNMDLYEELFRRANAGAFDFTIIGQ